MILKHIIQKTFLQWENADLHFKTNFPTKS